MKWYHIQLSENLYLGGYNKYWQNFETTTDKEKSFSFISKKIAEKTVKALNKTAYPNAKIFKD